MTALADYHQLNLQSDWPEQGHWTVDAWWQIPEDGFRYEIIEGDLFASPPPSIKHQKAVTSLVSAMHNFATRNETGHVLTSPIGVRIPGYQTVLQPDILFVSRSREEIIGENIIDGAPDLVVEVLSPSNWVYDRGRKQEAYRQAGVGEYWIVDYRARTIDVLVLEGSEYVQRGEYGESDTAVSEIMPGFEVEVAAVFAR